MSDRSDRPFDSVGIEIDTAVLKEPTERGPAGECIADGVGQPAAFRQAQELLLKPWLQDFCNLSRLDVAARGPVLRSLPTQLLLNGIQCRDPAQHFGCNRRARRLIYVIIFPSGVAPNRPLGRCRHWPSVARSQHSRPLARCPGSASDVLPGARPDDPGYKYRERPGDRIHPTADHPRIDPESTGAGSAAAGIKDRQHRIVRKHPKRALGAARKRDRSIATYAQEYEIRYGEMAAGAAMSMLPALMLILLGQRFVVRGLLAGAVK